MKKFHILVIGLFELLSFNVFSQIGISSDGTNPDNSAMLHVKSANKGLLIPQIAIRGVNDATTISNPASSLLVFNTSTESGFTSGYYYNAGTPSLPVWTRLTTTVADGTETKVTAGTNVTVTGSGTSGNPYVINSTGSGANGGETTHYLGELYGGGVVFYVDQTGNHGLICSMIDNSTGITWTTASFQTTTVPAPGALSDWNGQVNTIAIVTQAGAGTNYAAGLCDAYTNADYGTGVYSDWYLPTIDDLNLLYNAKRFVNKALDNDGNSATTAITKNLYWSSTESPTNWAWRFTFNHGGADGYTKSNSYYVRAVRSF